MHAFARVRAHACACVRDVFAIQYTIIILPCRFGVTRRPRYSTLSARVPADSSLWPVTTNSPTTATGS